MRKVIAIGILIGLGALLYFTPSMYKSKKEDTIDQLADGNIEEEEILSLAKAVNGDALNFSVEQLQVSPDQIVRFNAMVMKVMYRNGENTTVLTDEEIESLVRLQRMYYDEDLLKINDFGPHLTAAIDEVKKAREGKDWIVDYVVKSPIYDPNDSNIALVDVSFVPNSLGESTDINERYVVRRVDGLWYIKGWQGLGKSETINLE